MLEKDLEAILKTTYEEFDATTLEANPQKSMAFMHPDGVILEKGKVATYGYKDLLKLWTEWYKEQGPYEFKA
ncbi:hypothetical protein WR25_14863 [Diploscapter pachys]|uniref:DUF4440 domain-containing protein n=1 Tax=Diploscapter pachys TaxID=2018661 RepID=A0A2A2KNC0_9BILA|nr:hypothetical protein WR25_14863 [Diploscapter pachys]